MAAGQRYKFFGSTIQVTTSYATPGTAITTPGISLANPAVVTSTGHTVAIGDVVKITGITVGATQFNNNLYAGDDPLTTSFELAGTDNTLGAAWTAGGFVQEAVMSEMCELTGAAQAGGGADQEEVSTICSTAKEFEQGLGDAGTLTLDFNFAPLTLVQTTLRDSETHGTDIGVRITLPNNGGIIVMLGTVQTTSFNGAVGQAIWKGNAAIKLSGPIFVLDPV